MITTSLELSKRLKEAGYPQGESHFYYEIDGKESRRVCRYSGELGRNVDSHYASPTAEEILKELPKEDNDFGTLAVTWDDSRWCVGYYTFGKRGEKQWNSFIHQGSLCDSLATMYLHLKEHNLLPQ